MAHVCTLLYRYLSVLASAHTGTGGRVRGTAPKVLRWATYEVWDPFPTAAVRGRHILTRKEYLANFEGDTAGWAQYQEDQYYAERGVSLTADAEERLKTNTWETLGQAKARLFDTRVRSPNNRPTKLSKEANDARARRRRESRLLSQ